MELCIISDFGSGMALDNVLVYTGFLSIKEELLFRRFESLRQCSAVRNTVVQCVFSVFGHRDFSN